MIDREFLKALTEVPAVGTACGPAVRLLDSRFGATYRSTLFPDGFCLYQLACGSPADLKVVFVAHMDEIGGCVYGPRPDGGFNARHWGNVPEVFANAELQAFDYLAESADETYPVRANVIGDGDDRRLALYGDALTPGPSPPRGEGSPLTPGPSPPRGEGSRIRPYRTVWTFREETTFDGDVIEGKALDPRVTLYAVVEAVRALNSPNVGAMIVMAEECAMDVARKGVTYLQRNSPILQLIANADVPWIENLGEGRLDLPAIRIFEGRNFIDPSFGIRVAGRLLGEGVELHLSAARSGSQTLLFTPLAPTLSIALPSDGVHLPRVRMSLKGTERCQAVLEAIGRGSLNGAF